jgi:hypothetical protein
VAIEGDIRGRERGVVEMQHVDRRVEVDGLLVGERAEVATLISSWSTPQPSD